ncbi:MAG: carbon storage regulator [Gemmataceae bacterium]|nr:carbon storage regulator [Gemmataceae bacterium]
MQLFTTRPSDKVHLPDIEATIEVLAIEAGSVRLGVSAPDEVRVVREARAERKGGWKPEVGEEPACLDDIERLIDKRLEICREGLSEARQGLRAGDAERTCLVLEKIDEDLHLLRRRLRREFEKAESLAVGV